MHNNMRNDVAIRTLLQSWFAASPRNGSVLA